MASDSSTDPANNLVTKSDSANNSVENLAKNTKTKRGRKCTSAVHKYFIYDEKTKLSTCQIEGCESPLVKVSDKKNKKSLIMYHKTVVLLYIFCFYKLHVAILTLER